jgi:hypothetical protein
MTHTDVTDRRPRANRALSTGADRKSFAYARAPGHQIRGRLDHLLKLTVVSRHGQHEEAGKPNIIAAALQSGSTWSFLHRVLDTADREAQGHVQGKPGDRVLKRRATLEDEESANFDR